MSEAPFHIRPAAAGDAARIADLSTQLGYPSTVDEVRQRMKTIPADGSHAVYVAGDRSGCVVGWLHVFAYHPLEHAAVAEVAGLVVDGKCRGSGVGRKLMAAAEEWARQRKLSAIVLRSNVIRERAHTFYERLGYERIKTQHTFRKNL